jgi:hypothetical protein
MPLIRLPMARAICFTLMLLAAGGIRLLLAAHRPYTGDECGTMMYLCTSPWYILTHFQCWLTMNWHVLLTQLVAQCFGEGLVAMRCMSVLAGVGAIPLAVLIARRMVPGMPWIIPATLIACNPYLIEFSATVRVYALFTFLALLLWFFFLRWRELPNRLNGLWLSAACLLIIMFNLNGVFVFSWLVAAFVMEAAVAYARPERRAQFTQGCKRLLPSLMIAMAGAGLYYFQLLDNIRQYSVEWISRPFSSVSYLPDMFVLYAGSPSMAWLLLALLVTGLIRLARMNVHGCLLMLAWIVLPIAAASILGYAFNFWDFARFFIFLVPAILTGASLGIQAIAALLGPQVRRCAMGAMLCGIVLAWVPLILQFFEKDETIPYHKVYAHIMQQAQDGDTIVALEPLAALHMAPYLRCEQRLSILDQFVNKTIYLKTAVADMLQDPQEHAVFLISAYDYVLSVSADTWSFGELKLYRLPAESWADRYGRLLRAYARIATPSYVSEQYKDYLVYKTLVELALLGNDTHTAAVYSDLLEKVPSNRQQP